MKLVRQKHARGCGVAAFAMLIVAEYDTVAGEFERDLETQGLYQQEIVQRLNDRGYATLCKYLYTKRRIDGEQQKTEPWPPTPFAPAHFCNVTVYRGAPVSHFVVMRDDGVVLDPLSDEPKHLIDYFLVSNVVGVFKVV